MVWLAREEKSRASVRTQDAARYYLKEKGKNVIKAGKYKSADNQRYYCKHCETYIMETKGTPRYRKHLSEAELLSEICNASISSRRTGF